ncbi:glycosyl hydrolase family 8 [Salinibius halmophilus]|uniref:glycosyl hydrolase family 8 n=1 Tax=Salinibius halmophilus TaxID=1853216 RepID=UPI00131461DA|nr:glycosyl hydrolase family 8 [Salinibius halmophilus]
MRTTRLTPIVAALAASGLLTACNILITPITDQTPQPATEFYGAMPSGDVVSLQQEALSLSNAWLDRFLKPVQQADNSQLFVDYAELERSESWMTDKQAISVSEGHGYGMLILVAVAAQDARTTAKAEFDAMVNYWQAHKSYAGTNLMAWQQWDTGLNAETGAGVAGAGTIIDRPGGEANSATDGDLDMAYALIIANKLWPEQGYDTLAQSLLDDIRATIVMPDGSLRLGDWAATAPVYQNTTRPSDFLIQHLTTFAAFDQQNASTWQSAADRMVNHVELNTVASLPLLPDFGIIDQAGNFTVAPANHLESDFDSHYYYNSARQPWRISMPGVYNEVSSLDDNIEWMNDFFIAKSNGDPAQVYPGVWLSGPQQGEWIETAWTDLTFTAPLLVAAVADDRPEIASWRDALWRKLTTEHPMESEFYFGSSIRVLSVLTAVDLWPTL